MARALADFETRVLDLLTNTTHAPWSEKQIDEGLRQALAEYTRASLVVGAVVSANEKIGTVTPTLNWREVSLAALTGLLDVARVWFPYYGADPNYYAELPRWVDFELWWNASASILFLDIEGVPDGVQVARVFYRVAHTIDDLDGAAATSFSAADDALLVSGAAGFCCAMRALDLASNADAAISSAEGTVPNFKGIGAALLDDFRSHLTPRHVARTRRLRR